VNTEKVDPHLTAKIVQSYVRHHRLGPDQLGDLITSVYRAIGQLGQSPEPDEVLIPAVSVRRSIHRDYVVCLDCGYRGKMLRRHIATRHGLSRDDYRERWGLRSNHPLTATAYSEHRSTMAKARGFGRKLATPLDLAEKPTASPAPVNEVENPKVRRASKSRPVSKSKVAGEAAAAQSAKKRRSRVAMVASPSG
jgi:predicted transcriptional regulator